MNNKLGVLGGIILFQIILVLFLWSRSGDQAEETNRLLEFQKDSVVSMVISDATKSITLRREASSISGNPVDNTNNGDVGVDGNSTWTVGEFPADSQKVDAVLEKLSAMDTPWPVANSVESVARFETGDEGFQRKIELGGEDGSSVAVLYLGTSPGFQRVHARKVGATEVFSVALSNYEFGIDINEWLDSGLLAWESAPAKISIQFAPDDSGLPDAAASTESANSKTLEQTDEGWLVDGRAADQSAATSYANRFVTLQVQGIADSGTQAGDALAFLEITVRDEDGEDVVRTLKIMQVADAGDYLISEVGAPHVYKLATYIAEQLLMNDLNLLPQTDASSAQQASELPVGDGS